MTLSTNQLSFFPEASKGNNTKKLKRAGTFTDNMKLPLHRWFRYSAGFSAEWVATQISQKKDNVGVFLDPFAGSGTSLICAAQQGLNSIGIEPHPFVSKICRIKADAFSISEHFIDSIDTIIQNSKSSGKIFTTSNSLLSKCYTEKIFSDLKSLAHEWSIFPFKNSADKDLTWLAITAILREVSHVGTAQWQYVLPNKTKAKVSDPYQAFKDKANQIQDDIELSRKIEEWGTISVLPHDARKLSSHLTPNSVDLVVTSPPYPNNYDYADATRLEMTFWGLIENWKDLHAHVRQYLMRSCSQHTAKDKLELDNLMSNERLSPIKDELYRVCKELESVRLSKGGKKTYHTMIAAYFSDLADVWHELRTVMKDKSTLCFVIGDSAPYGVYAPADEWLGKLAISAGFSTWEFEKLRDRNIKWKNRKHTIPLKEGNLWIKG